MDKRKQFTFYCSYYDAILDLPKTQQAATLLALCAYALYGEEPKKLPAAASACFKLMRPTVDAGRAKAENGAKGGKANGKQNESKPEANQKQTQSKSKAKMKQTGSEKEVEVEKEVEIEKEIEVDVEVESKGDGEGEAPEPDATAAAQRLQLLHGKLGKGVIALTGEQISDLLEKLGLEVFDYYVDKLSAFIIKNDARVKNHYETILKWWREDSEAGQ